MSVFQMTKIEFNKIIKKKISMVMFAILLIPAFYTYSIMTDAELLQMTPSGGLDFALGQWGLLGMTGLFQILFSLITVATFSSELEKGQIKMAILHQCKRKGLVYAKFLALILYMLFCYMLYILFSLCCYYIFVMRTSYGTGKFVTEGILVYGLGRFILSGFFPLMDTLLNVGIVFLFSLRYKTGICYMLAMGTTTLLLIMQFFPVLQYMVPAYVGSLLDYAQITPFIGILFCIVYCFIATLCVEISARKFEKMDIQ